MRENRAQRRSRHQRTGSRSRRGRFAATAARAAVTEGRLRRRGPQRGRRRGSRRELRRPSPSGVVVRRCEWRAVRATRRRPAVSQNSHPQSSVPNVGTPSTSTGSTTAHVGRSHCDAPDASCTKYTSRGSDVDSCATHPSAGRPTPRRRAPRRRTAPAACLEVVVHLTSSVLGGRRRGRRRPSPAGRASAAARR